VALKRRLAAKSSASRQRQGWTSDLAKSIKFDITRCSVTAWPYTDDYLEKAGKDAPKFTDEELKVIASPLDFVGINVYKPAFYALASDQAPGWRQIPFAKSHPRMFNSWLALAPETIYWASKFVQSL